MHLKYRAEQPTRLPSSVEYFNIINAICPHSPPAPPCPTEMQLNIKGDAVQFLSSKNAPPDYATKGPA